jgi:predicted dienelactone hydrolase
MKTVSGIAIVLVSLLPLAPVRAQEAYKDKTGPYAVDRRTETWKDAAREREVPVRILSPRVKDEGGRPGKFPVVVFSHGLGGSRDGYTYIGEHLASHGYIVIHPTHAGSDTEAVKGEVRDRVRENIRPRVRDRVRGKGGDQPAGGFLKESTSDPDNLRNRPRDVSFVIDQLSKDEKLSPVADIEHVGVAGHSFGAYTGFAVAGMTIDVSEDEDGGKSKSFGDPRVKAVVAMSPQGTGAMGITKSSWDKIAVPVLSLTGTKDYGQGERAAAWRREGFDSTKDVAAMLVVIRDATHGTFADNAGARLTGAETSKDHDKHIRYVKMVATAYMDAYVRGDRSALIWLESGELAKFDDGACAIEQKPAPEKKEGPPVGR